MRTIGRTYLMLHADKMDARCGVDFPCRRHGCRVANDESWRCTRKPSSSPMAALESAWAQCEARTLHWKRVLAFGPRMLCDARCVPFKTIVCRSRASCLFRTRCGLIFHLAQFFHNASPLLFFHLTVMNNWSTGHTKSAHRL